MVDKNKQHEPVLMPEGEAKVKSRGDAKKRDEGPVLLSEDHRERKEKMPYILIFFVALGLLSVFWKMAFYGDEIKEQKNPVTYNHKELLEKALSQIEINIAPK